jgi:predicted nicotinamide N-methyase
MGPEEFITTRFERRPVPFWPDVSLYQPTARSGLSAWQEAQDFTEPPYWAYVWAGGAALAQHLQLHPEIVAGKTVLDFGAGSGLLAIIAAKLGAAAVFALETNPVGEVATRLNALANGVTVTIVPTLLHTDVALAGDVFYGADVAATTLTQLQTLQKSGVSTLIGDPYRTTLPRSALRELASYRVPDMGTAGEAPAGVFTLI